MLDAVIHPPLRLQLCALAAQAEKVDFAAARVQLKVSDSVMSKHLKALEDAGYAIISKVTVDSRRRTSFSLTLMGRAAFAAHVDELQRLASIVPAVTGGMLD